MNPYGFEHEVPILGHRPCIAWDAVTVSDVLVLRTGLMHRVTLHYIHKAYKTH